MLFYHYKLDLGLSGVHKKLLKWYRGDRLWNLKWKVKYCQTLAQSNSCLNSSLQLIWNPAEDLLLTVSERKEYYQDVIMLNKVWNVHWKFFVFYCMTVPGRISFVSFFRRLHSKKERLKIQLLQLRQGKSLGLTLYTFTTCLENIWKK
jgi:hypothetical protein